MTAFLSNPEDPASQFWYNEPLMLLQDMNAVWPFHTEPAEAQVNATTRFIVYVCVIAFVIYGDLRILMTGMGSVGLLYLAFRDHTAKPPTRPKQTLPLNFNEMVQK